MNTEPSILNLASVKNIKLSKELKGRLQSQQNTSTKATAQNDAAVKASFIVAAKNPPSYQAYIHFLTYVIACTIFVHLNK